MSYDSLSNTGFSKKKRAQTPSLWFGSWSWGGLLNLQYRKHLEPLEADMCSLGAKTGGSTRTTLLRDSASVTMMPKGAESVPSAASLQRSQLDGLSKSETSLAGGQGGPHKRRTCGDRRPAIEGFNLLTPS